MQGNTSWTKERFSIDSKQKTIENKTEDFSKLVLESLPKRVGFFYEYNLKLSDYFTIAKKLKFYVMKNHKEEFDKLEFVYGFDNVQSYINELMLIVYKGNTDYYPCTLLKFNEENGELKLLENIDLDYTNFHLSADLIDEIKSPKMKALFAYLFDYFCQLCRDNFMINTFKNYDNTYLSNNIEMEIENFNYTIDAAKENFEEMLEENPDETNEELMTAISEKEVFELDVKSHLKSCRKYKRKIKYFLKKYKYEDLKNHDFKNKNMNDFRNCICSLIETDIFWALKNTDYCTDDSGAEALFDDMFCSTLTTDSCELDRTYVRDCFQSSNDNGNAFLATVKILKSNKVIDVQTHDTEMVLKSFYQDMYEIFEHLQNEHFKP